LTPCDRHRFNGALANKISILKSTIVSSFISIMKSCRLLIAILMAASSSVAATLPLLKVSENRRYLETEHGAPFFYLGDTA
jgi:hypothetical protein